MRYEAINSEEYINLLPDDRKEVISKLRNVLIDNLPEGFEETISCGMISFVVPLTRYPKGYLANPKEPLPFISIASQKNHIAFYHMCLYANPELLAWFQDEYAARVTTKLDMGKGCIRFKNPTKIPFDLLAELCSKISVQDYIDIYDASRNTLGSN